MLGLVCVGVILLSFGAPRALRLRQDPKTCPTVCSSLDALLQNFAVFVVCCLKSFATAWLTLHRYKLTTSRVASRAPRATVSQSRLPVAVRAPTEFGLAAALQAMLPRSQSSGLRRA